MLAPQTPNEMARARPTEIDVAIRGRHVAIVTRATFRSRDRDRRVDEIVIESARERTTPFAYHSFDDAVVPPTGSSTTPFE